MLCIAGLWAMLLGGHLAAVAIGNSPPDTFPAATTVPNFPKMRAIQLACAYSGLQQANVVLTRCGVLSDSTLLYNFYHVKKRLAWQIIFSPMKLTMRKVGHTVPQQTHPLLLTVWLDATDGSLLKANMSVSTNRCFRQADGEFVCIASPDPTAYSTMLPLYARFIEDKLNGEGFSHFFLMPRVPMLKALTDAGLTGMSELTSATTEITAYFGLNTNPLHTDQSTLNHPTWFFVYDGITTFFTGADGPAIEWVMIDAKTGEKPGSIGQMSYYSPHIFALAAEATKSRKAGTIHVYLYNGGSKPFQLGENYDYIKEGNMHKIADALVNKVAIRHVLLNPPAIAPGAVGEETISIPARKHAPWSVSGDEYDVSVPAAPLPVRVSKVTFSADPHMLTLTCRNTSTHAVTLSGARASFQTVTAIERLSYQRMPAALPILF
jgi:hypothetical protein